MREFTEFDTHEADPNIHFLGFALSDCRVDADLDSARYLRAVHRTALELAVRNCFGVDVGGFWLLEDQIAQLRRLPGCYPPNEALNVTRAVEAYLQAQLQEFYFPPNPSKAGRTGVLACQRPLLIQNSQ